MIYSIFVDIDVIYISPSIERLYNISMCLCIEHLYNSFGNTTRQQQKMKRKRKKMKRKTKNQNKVQNTGKGIQIKMEKML